MDRPIQESRRASRPFSHFRLTLASQATLDFSALLAHIPPKGISRLRNIIFHQSRASTNTYDSSNRTPHLLNSKTECLLQISSSAGGCRFDAGTELL